MSDGEGLRISWSRVRLHDECPAKWELRKRHPSAVADIRNFVHGTVVDVAMRRWLEQTPPEPGWMLAHVEEIFEECTERSDEGIARWRNAGDRAKTLAFCCELVTRLEVILNRYCLPFEWEAAKRFAVPIKVPGPGGGMRQIQLIGETDLLVIDNQGRIVVWDLKATENDKYFEKVLGQLAFYAIAVKAMRGRFPVMTGLIQPMCTERVLPVTITEQAVREMAARITRTANDIWAGKVAPKVSSDCGWCDVQRVCPAFNLPTRPGRVALSRG